MKVLRVLFILSASILEWANSCNAFYDGHGLFGDNYMVKNKFKLRPNFGIKITRVL